MNLLIVKLELSIRDWNHGKMIVCDVSGTESQSKGCICTANGRPNSILPDTAFKMHYRIIKSCSQGYPNVS